MYDTSGVMLEYLPTRPAERPQSDRRGAGPALPGAGRVAHRGRGYGDAAPPRDACNAPQLSSASAPPPRWRRARRSGEGRRRRHETVRHPNVKSFVLDYCLRQKMAAVQDESRPVSGAGSTPPSRWSDSNGPTMRSGVAANPTASRPRSRGGSGGAGADPVEEAPPLIPGELQSRAAAVKLCVPDTDRSVGSSPGFDAVAVRSAVSGLAPAGVVLVHVPDPA